MANKSNKTLIKTIVGILILVVGGFLFFQMLPSLIIFAANTFYLALTLIVLVAVIYGLIRFIKW